MTAGLREQKVLPNGSFHITLVSQCVYVLGTIVCRSVCPVGPRNPWPGCTTVRKLRPEAVRIHRKVSLLACVPEAEGSPCLFSVPYVCPASFLLGRSGLSRRFAACGRVEPWVSAASAAMADVTARSLQYEYKAVREDAEEGCGRGRPWIATNSGGKADLGEGWIKTRRNNPSGV